MDDSNLASGCLVSDGEVGVDMLDALCADGCDLGLKGLLLS